jgi:hypothetical protein
MAHRIAAVVSALVVVMLVLGLPPVLAQDAGYQPPIVLPTGIERDVPSDPPATVEPGQTTPIEKALPPPVDTPVDASRLPATGLAFTAGLLLAIGLLVGGIALVKTGKHRPGI